MWEVCDVDGGRNNNEGKHLRVYAKGQIDGEPHPRRNANYRGN
jgi:hypothetical protein